jgi:hypothetical protein
MPCRSWRVPTLVISLGCTVLLITGTIRATPTHAASFPRSQNVALVPDAGGRTNNGGTFPITGFPDNYAPNFSNVSPEDIRDAATDPIGSGFDTVVLNSICDIADFLANVQFKSRIESFISSGGKLIIWDSECLNTDYSQFALPFQTNNPGQLGAQGTLTDIEENTLSSADPASPSYVHAAAVATQTDAVGDANVFTTFDPRWFVDLRATNANGVDGPAQAYANLGAGLVIYSGLDKDFLPGTSFDPAATDGVSHLNRIWLLELLQPWDPDNLPHANPVVSECIAHGERGWTVSAKVSDDDGLVIDHARLGPRLLARRISVPYFDITADWTLSGTKETRRAELTPSAAQGDPGRLSTTLIDFGCDRPGGLSLGIGANATYQVNGLPDGVTMWVKQHYRFDQRTTFCEPTGNLPCAQFWPTVTWGADVSPSLGRPFLRNVRIIQRFEFDPDASPAGYSRGEIFSDRARRGATGTRSTVETFGSNGSMKKEARVPAIEAGKRNQGETWDSWHQTQRDGTSAPGSNPVSPHPGCSECVHAHWAWGKSVNLVHPGFTDGKPVILDGSRQTTYIAVARYDPSPYQIDPNENPSPCINDSCWGYRGLINEEKIRDSRPVVFWDMKSPGTGLTRQVNINGREFDLGDAAWPQLSDGRHGGNGSMFFAPARVLSNVQDSHFKITPRWGKAAEVTSDLHPRLPAGWVLPVEVKYPCGLRSRGKRGRLIKPQGPFWIHTTTSNGQQLINPDPDYAAIQVGIPWVTLRTDKFTAGSTPNFTQGEVVRRFNCTSGKDITYTAYLVLRVKPTKDDVSVRLLGAPDGDDQFEPFDEP